MMYLEDKGPVNVMLLKLDILKDSEGTRAEGENFWSKDYQLLSALLERKRTVVRRKGIEFTLDDTFYDSFSAVLSVEPVGENSVLLYWQTKEQAAQNKPLYDGEGEG